MAAEEKTLELKDILKETYKDVTEWLKFAEAKNGILLTVIGVFLFGLLRLLSSELEWILPLENTLLLVILILSSNLIVVLISYFPMLNIMKKSKKNMVHSERNLIFYKDIALFTKEEYIETLEKKYNIKVTKQEEPFIKDQIDQIIALSQIAVQKYMFFRIGVTLIVVSVVIVLIKIFYTYLG